MVWLTERRVRLYCGLIILFYLCCWSAMIWFTCQPTNKRFCDFVQFWTAGRLVQEGQEKKVYDFCFFVAQEQKVLGRHITPVVFRYPPTLFPIVKVLAYLPYGFAYGLFVFFSVFAFVGACYVIYPHRYSFWLVLACPIVYENVSFGQNGLINGAIFGFALYVLRKRPLFAGLFFGLLTYKVHLVLLVPFALIAGRHWRALFSMVATASLMVGLSLVLYGFDVWQLFFSVSGPNAVFHPVVSFADMVTPWGAIYLLTENASFAWGVQIIFSLLSLGLVIWFWRKDVSFYLKAALLLLLSLLVTPYAFVYDLTFLGLALIFLAKDGVQDGEEKFFVFSWSFVALSSLVAAAHSLPLAFLVLLSMTALSLRRLLIPGGTKAETVSLNG